MDNAAPPPEEFEKGPFNKRTGGNIGEILKTFDWSKCSLGDFKKWEKRFQSALTIAISTIEFPMSVCLGEDLCFFYNDAYIPILGEKHPDCLGKPTREVFSETWELKLKPLFNGIMKSKKPVHFSNLLFLLKKQEKEKLYENYYTFCYSPLWSSPSTIGGIFATVSPTTDEVITRRQFQTLNQLALHSAEAKTIPDACNISMRSIETNPSDFHFALLYTTDMFSSNDLNLTNSFGASESKASKILVSDCKRISLPKETSSEGLEEHSSATNAKTEDTLGNSNTSDHHSASESFRSMIIHVAKTGKPEEFDLISNGIILEPCGNWSQVPKSCYIIPVITQDILAGILVVGLNCYRDLDDSYRSFLSFCGGQFGNAIANARAHEEERKRAEALAELDRAKTTFFHNISHEFRTPLTLMLVPLEEMMKETSDFLPQTHYERISIVYRNGLRLLKLVNTLLDFSRIEANRTEACFEPTDLQYLTVQLATVFTEAIEGAGLKFLLNCEKLSELVYVDRDMFEQILLNLISNAFKYTLQGEVEVRLTSEDNNAIITIRDTGNGISASELPHIFQRFYRAKNSGGRSHEGTGIGLSMVNELVRLHGGAVGVESELGKGSVFTVKIPYGSAHLPSEQIKSKSAPSQNTNKAEQSKRGGWWLPNIVKGNKSERIKHSTSTDMPRGLSHHASDTNVNESESSTDRKSGYVSPANSFASISPASSSAIENEKATILFADDNSDMREFVCGLLKEHYEVIAVGDGQEALEVLKTRIPDLVLTDIMMPRLDGFGLLDAIRANPTTSVIPVIFLSARAGEDSVSQGFHSTVDDYIVKPFTARELLARVAAHVKIHKIRLQALKKEQEYLVKEEANKAKDHFLAVLSHELRTPLAPALLLAETLERDFADSKHLKERDDISMIKRCIALEVRLIDDLLDLTRVSKGKVRLDLEVVSVKDLLEHTLQLLQPEILEKSLHLELQFEAQNYYTLSDPARVQQIFWNIIKNAIKFTHVNGNIFIKTWNVEEDQKLRVSVKDDGMGISSDVLPKLFNPFEQGSRSQFGGLGLGLYISRVIASLHKGNLTASSEGSGKGSCFTVTLNTVEPPEDVSSTHKIPIAPIEQSSLPPVSPLKILLVEDNKTTNWVMTRLLERLGHHISAAFSGKEAIEKAGEEKFDLLISDIGLPDMNGWEIMKGVQEKQKVKGIALSGYGMEEDVKKSLEAGFMMHLTKPVQVHVLENAIAQLMKPS